MSRQAARSREDGFSLLEVMVSLALLAMALVVLVGISTENVRATHHARMITTATFLARTKMADLEDQILEEGFVDNDQEEEGDFADNSRPEFRWKTLIEKVELPTDVGLEAAQAAQEQTLEATNPMAAMAGLMGGFMTTLIEPIRVGLEESVRRVTVRVAWDEPGRPDRSFEVITFMTDPAKLDMAVQAIGQPPGGVPGQQQQGTGTGSTGTGSSSSGRTSSPSTPSTSPTGGGSRR